MWLHNTQTHIILNKSAKGKKYNVPLKTRVEMVPDLKGFDLWFWLYKYARVTTHSGEMVLQAWIYSWAQMACRMFFSSDCVKELQPRDHEGKQLFHRVSCLLNSLANEETYLWCVCFKIYSFIICVYMCEYTERRGEREELIEEKRGCNALWNWSVRARNQICVPWESREMAILDCRLDCIWNELQSRNRGNTWERFSVWFEVSESTSRPLSRKTHTFDSVLKAGTHRPLIQILRWKEKCLWSKSQGGKTDL